MKKTLIFAALTLMMIFPTRLFSQHSDWCITDHKLKEIFQNDPSKEIEWNQLNQWIEENQQYLMETSECGNYIIPMVLQIIHNYGSENISDAQVVDAIRILNEDFNKENTDTANVVTSFKSRIGDTQFEFRLAKKDPSGNCSNGITRTPSLLTYDADDNSKLISWPRAKYFNMWVVSDIYTESTTSVTAGYATLPGTASDGEDGIILDDNYVGSIGTSNSSNFNKRVLTHEAGHFFNLLHPWGWGQIETSCAGSDFVNDTPPTQGSFSTCILTKNICGQLENVQNFMDYSTCTNMFTTGQANRMISAINNSSGQRSSLWQSSNLIATGTADPYVYPPTCAPKADFKTNRFSICAGSSINLTDQSYNATPTSWNWTISDGVNTLNSTQQNPSITIPNPGMYNVTLTVSSPGGNDTEVKNAYIYVYPTTAQFDSYMYTDLFDNSPMTSNRWSSQYDWSATVGWQETNQASYSAPNALRLNNFNSNAGVAYSVFSPSYNFASLSGTPTLTFKYAFAKKVNENNDVFKVSISSNCGQSWNVRYTSTGSVDLATVGNKSSSWAPASAAEWKSVTLTNLGAWANQSNVRFKFELVSDGGNNLYLDDINIVGPNVNIDEVSGQDIPFVFYPNPASDQIQIDMDVLLPGKINFQIIDMTGRVALQQILEAQQAGAQHFVLPINHQLSSGMYFLSATIGNVSHTKKILIQH